MRRFHSLVKFPDFLQAELDRNLPNFFDGLEIGDATLADGRRVVLFTSKKSLEMPKQPTFDTSIGPISLNFDESSCLEPDQIPQTVRPLRSLPDDSQLPPPPPVASSSMMKKNEKKQVTKRKYSCDEPDCQKSYTQSHNLKSHKKNKHNL